MIFILMYLILHLCLWLPHLTYLTDNNMKNIYMCVCKCVNDLNVGVSAMIWHICCCFHTMDWTWLLIFFPHIVCAADIINFTKYKICTTYYTRTTHTNSSKKVLNFRYYFLFRFVFLFLSIYLLESISVCFIFIIFIYLISLCIVTLIAVLFVFHSVLILVLYFSKNHHHIMYMFMLSLSFFIKFTN